MKDAIKKLNDNIVAVEGEINAQSAIVGKIDQQLNSERSKLLELQIRHKGFIEARNLLNGDGNGK